MSNNREGVEFSTPSGIGNQSYCRHSCELDAIDMIVDRESGDVLDFLLEEVETVAPLIRSTTTAISDIDTYYSRIDRANTRERFALCRSTAQHATVSSIKPILLEQGLNSLDELYSITSPDSMSTVRQRVLNDIVLSSDFNTLVMQGIEVRKTGDYDTFVQRAFSILFSAEIYQRICLAEALLNNSSAVLRYMFDDPGLDGISQHLLQLVYTDSQANGSSILRNTLHKDNAIAIHPEHYLRIGNFSSHATAALGGMVAGLCIAGGEKCQLNTLGLCERFVNNSHIDAYPSEVQSDIMRVNTEISQQRLTCLESIKTNGKVIVSKWFQFSGDIRSIYSRQSQTSKQGVSGNPSKRATQLDPYINEPRVKPEVAAQRYIKELYDIPFVVQGFDQEAVDPEDETGVTVMINMIMQSKNIAEYLNGHREVKQELSELVRGMIYQICLPREHRDVGGVLPLSTVRPKTIDGVSYRAWRCSGKGIVHDAGKVGDDTRIYYWVATDPEGNRNIRISKICTKADSVKPMNQNRVAV